MTLRWPTPASICIERRLVTRSVVLTEKLRRPEPGGLGRRRLEELLIAPSDSRLDLVVAPPGSGKTTLLARVAAAVAAAGTPVAWYRITADDLTEPAFVAHLARALHLDPPPDPESGIVTDVLESLDASPATPAMVVFDDVHEIAGSAAERALEQFVQLRPRHLRVLVGSRRPPDMNIPRLRVSGQLREITSEDLRFRSWEVEELFISVFREPLSPESAAALTRRTGGWAAGLQLFHLATSGRSAVDRGRAVDDLGGRSKLVRSYLARNVLAELPEERRHFLLRTCTLGTLTGPLCDALLGVTGSSAVLDELEHRQLFTSSDDDGQTFRYHEVLRTHLEWALVQEFGAAGASECY
jgi:ATP/maltotriose-dependent transcriptional regulator MalT